MVILYDDICILPYLDIPLQHASPKILKAMKRPAAAENNLARIKAWREICPELTIRSTFIVGFPGETEEDFQILLDFLEEAQLDRVGCFTYSAVDGAKANALADPVPEDIKEATQVCNLLSVKVDRIRHEYYKYLQKTKIDTCLATVTNKGVNTNRQSK